MSNMKGRNKGIEVILKSRYRLLLLFVLIYLFFSLCKIMQKGNLNNSLCLIKAYLWDNDVADLL